MAYAVIMEFDADWATHLEIDEAVGDAPIEGLMVHAAGPSDAGTRTVDIWASREDSERFFSERIYPALETLGIESGPPLSVQAFDVDIVRVS
jgi:hypothetical protein